MSLTGKQVRELQSLYESVYAPKEIKEDIILTEEEFEELCESILEEAFDAIVIDEIVKKTIKTAASNPGFRSKALDLMKTAASKIFKPKTTAGGLTRLGVAGGAGAIEGKTDGKTTRTGLAALNPKNIYGYLKGMSTAVDKNMQGAGQILKDKEKGTYYTTDQASKKDLKNSFEFDNFNLYIVEDAKSLEDLTKELNKQKNKKDNTNINTNIKTDKPEVKVDTSKEDEAAKKKAAEDKKKADEKRHSDAKKKDKLLSTHIPVVSKTKLGSTVRPVKPGSSRDKMIAKNELRHGSDKIVNLRKKNADFQRMKKGEISKMDFMKQYPKSQTTKKYNMKQIERGKQPIRSHYEPYDLVLDYVLSEGHASTVEEAHYVMMQMSQDTIQTIVSEYENV